jgi:hypothetical protein
MIAAIKMIEAAVKNTRQARARDKPTKGVQ